MAANDGQVNATAIATPTVDNNENLNNGNDSDNDSSEIKNNENNRKNINHINNIEAHGREATVTATDPYTDKDQQVAMSLLGTLDGISDSSDDEHVQDNNNNNNSDNNNNNNKNRHVTNQSNGL